VPLMLRLGRGLHCSHCSAISTPTWFSLKIFTIPSYINRTFTFNKASLVAGQTQLLGALSGRTSSPSDDVNASEEILQNDPRARTSKTATFALWGSNSTTQTEKSDNSTKNWIWRTTKVAPPSEQSSWPAPQLRINTKS
jgi:hypothetical protein